MAEAGPALMAIGRGSGANRAADAAQMAICQPAARCLDQRRQGRALQHHRRQATWGCRSNAAAQIIRGVVDPDAEIIFGTAIDPKIGDEVKITVIATGFARPVAVSPIPEEYRRQPPLDDRPVTVAAIEPEPEAEPAPQPAARRAEPERHGATDVPAPHRGGALGTSGRIGKEVPV